MTAPRPKPRVRAVVAAWPTGRNFGFARTPDGRRVLVHRQDLGRDLAPGERLTFTVISTVRGQDRAVDVQLGGRVTARPGTCPRASAVRREPPPDTHADPTPQETA